MKIKTVGVRLLAMSRFTLPSMLSRVALANASVFIQISATVLRFQYSRETRPIVSAIWRILIRIALEREVDERPL